MPFYFLFLLQSFFGRTYNNLSSISECKNNGECVINKKNRTACKACRLRKCLLVGMSKSGSRYGRRSNWFKIHCLLQEQQNKANNNSQTGNNIGSNNDSPNQTHHHPPNTNSILSNDFISSHFLANLYNNYNNNNNNNGMKKSQEIKRVSSPSDSGASSADPEESNLKFLNNNNLIAKSKNLNLTKPPLNSFCENIEKTNSSSNDGDISPVIVRKMNSSMKPLSPFLPFTLHHPLSTSALSSRTPSTPDYFMLPLPRAPLSLSPLEKHAFSDEQREPIDLSVKSNKRFRDYDNEEATDAMIRSPPLAAAFVNEAPKTVPLDLTLGRSD